MSDIFTNRFGALLGQIDVVIERQIGANQMATERAVTAYRQGIATPDVHIADRKKEFVPVIVGEDGEDLTPERRAQLMKEAGVKPMFDKDGKATGEIYTEAFDFIKPERLGKRAEENREGYRVVQPRELELDLGLDESSLDQTEPIKD